MQGTQDSLRESMACLHATQEGNIQNRQKLGCLRAKLLRRTAKEFKCLTHEEILSKAQ